jgi:argininosuccinate lyase
MLRNTKVNREVCQRAAADPALLATDLAEYLVRKGVAFRQAHHAVGTLVALAERLVKPLNRLTLAELKSVEGKFDSGALKAFDLARALGNRRLPGSPGTAEVKKQLARWKKRL